MGQQQLLLLILGIVLVGVAVVIGISTFSERNDEADFDASASEAMRVAGNILSWKHTPSTLGGGSNAAYLTGVSFDRLGYASSNKRGSRSNGGRFIRSFHQTTTELPYITVSPLANPSIRVQLFMYGPAPDCYKLRKAKLVDGDWINADIAVGRDGKPGSCKGW